jgi:osmotically-inducible protein OsmY
VISLIAVTGLMLSVTMYVHHRGSHSAQTSVKASVNDGHLITALEGAGLPLRHLIVQTVGDITVLRGDAPDAATIAQAAEIVRKAGARRIANLIRVPAGPDDDAIRREAERQLAQSRALDGCTFAVSCTRGVLTVRARVNSELQADAARSLLNRVDGVERLEIAFAR